MIYVPQGISYDIFNLVIAIGHNKSCTAFGCKGSLAGPEGNTDIHLKLSVVKDSHGHI